MHDFTNLHSLFFSLSCDSAYVHSTQCTHLCRLYTQAHTHTHTHTHAHLNADAYTNPTGRRVCSRNTIAPTPTDIQTYTRRDTHTPTSTDECLYAQIDRHTERHTAHARARARTARAHTHTPRPRVWSHIIPCPSSSPGHILIESNRHAFSTYLECVYIYS